MKAFTDSKGRVHPISDSKGYSPAKGGTAPGVAGLRAYAKSKGLTVHTVPEKSAARQDRGYKFNIRGEGRGIYATSMSARGLTDAKKLLGRFPTAHQREREHRKAVREAREMVARVRAKKAKARKAKAKK